MGTLTPILFLHLFGLGIFCLLYYLFRQKAVGRAFWAIAASSSCLGTFGLLYVFVYFVRRNYSLGFSHTPEDAADHASNMDDLHTWRAAFQRIMHF
jgi:hypothetical protein